MFVKVDEHGNPEFIFAEELTEKIDFRFQSCFRFFELHRISKHGFFSEKTRPFVVASDNGSALNAAQQKPKPKSDEKQAGRDSDPLHRHDVREFLSKKHS